MRNPAQAIEKAIDRDFVALLLAQNRVGASRPLAEVLYSHAVTMEEFDNFAADPTFETLIQRYVKQLNEEGFGIEQKAAALHELGVPIVFDILRDTEQPAMARLKAHEMLGDISGKGKAQKLQQLQASANRYQLVINLGPAATPETFNGTTIEQTAEEVEAVLDSRRPPELLPSTAPVPASPVVMSSYAQTQIAGLNDEAFDEASAYM